MPLIGLPKVKKAIDRTVEGLNTDLRKAYIKGFSEIIKGTPVDKGRARNNWFLTFGTPSRSTTTIPNNNPKTPNPKNVLGKKTYLTNNLPYITKLEYGGFPDPAKKGSYLGKGKGYKIKTTGGFSNQARKGWVRSAMARIQAKIRAL